MICYLSLLLLRLLEFKVFENKLNSSEIANGFIKNEYNLNITNAKAERMNRTIGDILRNAFGYKSFDRLRKRVLYIEREKSKNNIKKLGSGLISQPRKTPVDFKVPFFILFFFPTLAHLNSFMPLL